jgi:hypothetical protein
MAAAALLSKPSAPSGTEATAAAAPPGIALLTSLPNPFKTKDKKPEQ